MARFARGGLYGGVQGFWLREMYYPNYSKLILLKIL